MKIRNKLVVFFLVQHFIFFVGAFLFIEFVVQPKNLDMEQKEVKSKLSQILNIFETEKNHLILLISDWAMWDDMYNYVKNRNINFIESNFPEEILKDIKLNRMEIFDIDGNSIYCKDDGTINGEVLTKSPTTFSKNILKFVEKGNKWHKHGIMPIKDNMALVAINPILRGDKQGNPIGTLLMIRLIDEEMIANINKSTNSDISLQRVKDFSSLDKMSEKDFFTEPVDEENIIIYGFLRGLDNNVSIILKSNVKRDFMIQAKDMILNFFVFAVLAGIISLLVSLYSMQISIVRHLKQLLKYIVNTRNGVEYIHHDLWKKKDEIGRIAKEFNLLLEKLNKTNSKLIRLARVDGLTGIANRLDMEEKLEQEINISVRKGEELTILMLDIDYFKLYNDTYGHIKGDQTLTLVAQTIKNSSVRSGDHFSRYGGEEFIGILPNTNKQGAVTIVKRILKNIENLNIEHKSSLLKKKTLSVSIGSVSLVAKQGDTQEFIINMADEALYMAKRNGRDGYFPTES